MRPSQSKFKYGCKPSILSSPNINPASEMDGELEYHCLMYRESDIGINKGSCMSAHFFIEFIKRVEEMRSNARLAKHFISFSQRV